MSLPRPVVSIANLVTAKRVLEQSLCYIDAQGVKHAMCWLAARASSPCEWVTTCGISLQWSGRVSQIDLRDIVMSFPSCLECIAACLTSET